MKLKDEIKREMENFEKFPYWLKIYRNKEEKEEKKDH